MRNQLFIQIGKTVSRISQLLNRGNGSTWPGHIALKGNKQFVHEIIEKSQTQIIIVAGTNGKTTTCSLIATGLQKNGKTVLQNASGANLLNGIASTLLLNTDSSGKITQDYAIFEVDENALPHVLRQVSPDYLVLLNLFRDQLDRYGEINSITEKWQDAIATLPETTKLILNADDPQIASLGLSYSSSERSESRSPSTGSGLKRSRQARTILFFGLELHQITNTSSHQAADSISCPKCGSALDFENVIFSHLGKWQCKKCGLKRPTPDHPKSPYYPLTGTYNQYNTHAAVIILKACGLNDQEITTAFQDFKPAFGRQEIITYKNKKVQLFLSKNPTSFNQSFATIKEQNASTILLILNDRIPDGRDISWIWDTDLTGIDIFKHIIISGDRTYDMALRVKYETNTPEDFSLSEGTHRLVHPEVEGSKFEIEKNLQKAIEYAIEKTSQNETLYILPTYSAMLDARKILTGKKIL